MTSSLNGYCIYSSHFYCSDFLSPWLRKQQHYDNILIHFLLPGATEQRLVWWCLNTSRSLSAGEIHRATFKGLLSLLGLWLLLWRANLSSYWILSLWLSRYGLLLGKIEWNIPALQLLYIYMCWHIQVDGGSTNILLIVPSIAPWPDKLSCFKLITYFFRSSACIKRSAETNYLDLV